MSDIQIDAVAFERRLARLFDHYDKHKDTLYENCTVFQIFMGGVNEDEKSEYVLHKLLLLWLIGYEFTETIVSFEPKTRTVHFFTRYVHQIHQDAIHPITLFNSFLTNDDVNLFNMFSLHHHSPKKVKILQGLPNPSDKIKIMEKDKKRTSSDFFASLSLGAHTVIGVIEGEKHTGALYKDYADTLKKHKTVDIKVAFLDLLASKEAEEVQIIKPSCQYTSKLFKKIVTDMEGIIDEGKEITHIDFAKKIEGVVTRAAGDMDLSLAFNPIIQSGGGYNLKLDFNDGNVKSDDHILKFDNIILMFGLRYKSYCSFVARTYFIDASREKEMDYEILYSVYDFLVKKKIRVGATLDSIYISAREFLRKKKPELVPYFSSKVGFGIGLQPCSSTLEIAEGNNTEITNNMTFVLQLGLENVPEPNNPPYTMYIADTIVVSTDDYVNEKNAVKDVEFHEECQILTRVKIEYSQVSYSIQDEDEVEEVEPEDIDEKFGQRQKRGAAIASGLVRGSNEATDSSVITEEERRKRQLALLQKKREEYAGNEGSSSTSARKKKQSIDEKFANGDLFSYKGVVPKNIALPSNQIVVDKRNHTVLLPINGAHVPFHIASIKNVSKTDEGEYVHLRINFNNTKQNFGKVYEPAKKFKDHVFIKEVSYRAKDSKRLESAMREILELRKQIGQEERDREFNEKNKEVEQPKLKLVSKGQKAPRLADIFMRPPGKKQVGVIEAHENGLRFSSNKGAKIDIMYSNIKHAFFQEAKNDIIVLIHFHLKHPVMIGKKSYQDVQFFTEVIEEFDHLVGRHRRQAVSEREAIEEEERERLLKIKLNKEFASFVKKVEEKSGIEFEIPFRNLEFSGVPSTGRSNVNLVPTVNCLVSLSESPFFVLTMDEVEIAHFERIKFGLKNFDLVFIMKDLTTYYTITSIPIEKLESIKDWLTDSNVLYFEGAQSLKWGPILKTIREEPNWDPYGEAGWNSFLMMSGEEAETDEEEGEHEDEYEPSSGEEEQEDDEEDEEMYIDSDDDEDDDFSAEEEEDAPTWEELENEAMEEDAQKRARDADISDDEEDYHKPKKNKKKK